MRPKFLFSTCCLLVTLLVDSFADSKNINLSKSNLEDSRRHSKLSRLMDGTPVDKADGTSKLESGGNHKTGQNGQQGDTISQPAVANPYGASAGANAYGTQNLYGTGAAYGSNPPLYGNPYGAQLAPNNYPYSGAYGSLNPCGCSHQNQFAHGARYNQNSFQGSKLQRNQDAIGKQGYQYNQGYNGMPPYVQYPSYNVQYPLSPAYPAPPVGYVYPQNSYYPYNYYPYNYYGPQLQYHHHLQRQQQHDSRHAKKHRVKKQRGKSYRDKAHKDARMGDEEYH